MSRIYFHNEHGESEVYGPERHWMGHLCNELLMASLNVSDFRLDRDGPDPILNILPTNCYLRDRQDTRRTFYQDFKTYVSAGFSGHEFVYRGQPVTAFAAALNTALAMGSDPIRLCARLHGQCEIHCYVEEPNRPWLADIIEQGRTAGILREGMGWEATVALLRDIEARPGPVVCSYSVTDQFPNRFIAKDAGLWEPPVDEDGEENDDAWYDLPTSDQWRLAMPALRTQKNGLELTPAHWANFYFYDGITGFHLREEANAISRKLQSAPDTNR